MQAVLNKRDKEQLVIKLHQEGKTIGTIASAAHLSFSDIGSIIHKIDGKVDDGVDLKNKSPETKALFLFANGKKPIDVAIELRSISIRSPKLARRVLGFERSSRTGIHLQ